MKNVPFGLFKPEYSEPAAVRRYLLAFFVNLSNNRDLVCWLGAKVWV